MFVIPKKNQFKSKDKHEEHKQIKLKQLRKVIQRELYQLKQLQSEVASTLRKFQSFFTFELANLMRTLFKPERPIPTKHDKHQSLRRISPYGRRESKKIINPIADNTSQKPTFRQQFQQLRYLQYQEDNLRAKNEELKKERKSLSHNKYLYSDYSQSSTKTPSKSIKKVQTQAKVLRNRPQNNFSPTFGHSKSNNYLTHEGKYNNYSYQTHRKPKENIQTRQNSHYQVLKCSQGHQYFRGQLQAGVPHGNGIITNCCYLFPMRNPKIQSYHGQFEKGLFQGKGTLILKGGVRFQGSFKGGKRHGHGMIFVGVTGERGRWSEDKLI